MGFAMEDELVGLGVPPQLAFLIGDQPLVQAGTGTSQTGATLLKGCTTELTTTGGNTAFLLQTFGPNTPYFLFNSASTTALVFCPSGATINGSSNGSVSIAQNKGAIVWEYKKGFWCSIVTA
jgi:hypothetical protein